MLPKEEQMKVFNPISNDRRLIVVSTNIAETSLTIPGIKYVVDSGKEKNKVFDPKIGLEQFKIDWISKASADQRAGRAGRTAPGHCYRLYSSAVFDSLLDFSYPQIRTTPIDQTILSLKSMGVKNLTKFPFVTPPSNLALLKALQHLWILGALQIQKKESRQVFDFFKQQQEIILNLGQQRTKLYDDSTQLTTLGKLMSCLPLSPQYAKMIVLSKGLKITPYIILLVSGLTVDQVFNFSASSQLAKTDEIARITREQSKIEQELIIAMDQSDVDKIQVETLREKLNDLSNKKKEIEENLKKKRNHQFRQRLERNQSDYSDGITLINVLIEFFKLKESHQISTFAAQYSLSVKSLIEIKNLVHQLIAIYLTKIPNSNDLIPQLKLLSSGQLEKPSQQQEISICKIITAALCDKVARKKVTQSDQEKKKSRAQYQIQESQQIYFIHPSSSLYRSQPEYLVYTQIYQNANGKSYLKNVTHTQTSWLCSYGKALIFTPPLNQKALPKQILERRPCYNEKKDRMEEWVQPVYGYTNWTFPPIKVKLSNYKNYFYFYFARLLLEGKIIKKGFIEWKQNYKFQTKVITEKIGAITKPEISYLIGTLKSAEVENKADLIKIWKTSKNFLLSSVLMCVARAEEKMEIKSKWPPILFNQN